MVKRPDGSYLPGNSRHIHQVISVILFDLITIENIDGCPKLKISVLLGLRNRGFVKGIVMDDGKDTVLLIYYVAGDICKVRKKVLAYHPGGAGLGAF